MSIPRLEGSLLPLQDIQGITQRVIDIRNIADGKIISLTPDDRRKYGSVNETNKLFINKIVDLMNLYPQFVPPTFDRLKFDSDYNFRTELERITDQMQVLSTLLESGKIAYDYNNYKASLAIYGYIQYLGNMCNDALARSAAEELATFFSRTRTEETPPTDTTPDM